MDGAVPGLATDLTGAVNIALDGQLGSDTPRRVFGPPLQDMLAQVLIGNRATPLAWHTDQCAHLNVTAGTCPQKAGQVMVSASYARGSGLRPGDTVSTSSLYGRLTVTGVYAVPSATELTSTYWLDGPCDDFAAEDSCTGGGANAATQWDAMFTPQSTFEPQASWNGQPIPQGQATTWLVLTGDKVRSADLGPLAAAAGVPHQRHGARRAEHQRDQLHPAACRPGHRGLGRAGRAGVPDRLPVAPAGLAAAVPDRHRRRRSPGPGGRAG